MKHLVFDTVKSMPFLISLTVFICSAMYVLTDDYVPGIDDIILKVLFYVSIPSTIITFIIMWKSRRYDED